ncbi:MAG: hypothetical protein Q7K37_02260, partial [Dehalococcoidia bacterium]|nr:hypothetical protein [Dehalococcoidia bacterium]
VNYTRAGVQVIKGASTYHNLTLSGSAAKTGTTGITVNGTFTLAASATFTPGAFAYTLLGNFVNNSDAVTPVTAVAGSILNFDTPSPAAATSIGGSSGSTLALTVLNFNNTSGVSTSKTITSTTVSVGGSATFTNSGTFTSTALTVSGGATLTNNGTMTSTALTVNGTFTNPAAGTHTVSGVFTVAGGGLYTNNGTTTAAGTLVGAGSLVAGTNSTLNLNNAAAPTITTLTLSTNTPNTVTYGGAAQTIRAGSYSHLTLQNSGIKTAAGALTVSGTFTLTGTAAFTAGAFTHTFSGNWVHDTTVATPLVTTGSTITFDTPSPAAARSISGTGTNVLAFEAINVQNTSGVTLSKTISATGLITVSGSLTVAAAATVTISGTGALTVANGASLSNAGTVTVTGTGTITVGSGSAATFTNTGTVTTPGLLDGSGSFLNNANATLNITGSAAPSVTTFNLTGSTPNTVNYSLGGAQTIRASTYHHLTLSTSGTKTAGGSITVNGTFTLSGTASFATTAVTHHIKGNWVHATGATVSAAGGSVVSFEGASATISGAASVPLAFAGVSLPSGASVTSFLNLSTSGTFTVHSGGTLTLDPDLVVSGAGTFSLASGGTL